MDRLAQRIVKHRRTVLAVMLAAAVFCGFLMTRVGVNLDMTKYLPDSSSMKQGIDILAEEFPNLSEPSTIRVMFHDLSDDQVTEIKDAISSLDYVDSVTWDESDQHTKTVDGMKYTLFTVSTSYVYMSDEELSIEHTIKSEYEDLGVEVVNDDATGMEIPVMIFIVALAILLVVLFVMCDSWLEPFLFLGTIGVAILLNMGTNIFMGEISNITYSISAILQLVLSMDYSIILMNRYRQEKEALLKGTGAKEFAGIPTKSEKKQPSGNRGAANVAAAGPARAGRAQTSQEAGCDGGTGHASAAAETATGHASAAAETAAGRALREQAMSQAWTHAFSSVASSGFTTVVGLFMLVFMRFKIGMDIGIVLAKGVFLSMVCVLTVLPALILLFDRGIEKYAKKSLNIPSGWLATFSYKARYVLTIGFVFLFAVSYYLQSIAGISYTLSKEDPIADIFPSANPVVLVYTNEDEDAAAGLAAQLEEDPDVISVQCYATTLGKQMTPQEMVDYIEANAASYGAADADLSQLNEQTLSTVYSMYGATHDDYDGTMSIEQLFNYVSDDLIDNPLFGRLISDDLKESIASYKSTLEEGKGMLIGQHHSLMQISTSLSVESSATDAWIEKLETMCGDELSGDWHLIGSSVMSVEMQRTFGSELLLITILTAASIFVVVAVTFKQLLIPLLLVALVQCGVYLTVTTTWLMGYNMYYLALIIVQCILMGATVDYGILYTNYYRETRQYADRRDALKFSYEKSFHTILTSSLFMIFGTGAIGFSPVEATIAQICRSICLGAASATLLVLFVLPGMLSALDRFVISRKAGPYEGDKA